MLQAEIILQRRKTALTEAAASLVPVSPGKKLCLVCVNKCRISLKRMGSRHLLSRQSWALIQYCAELGIILKKYLANSQQASYSLFCLFTPPSCYVIKKKSLHWNMSRWLREPSSSKTLSGIFWLEKLNSWKVQQCSTMEVIFAGSSLCWCRQLGGLQPVFCIHWKYLPVEWAIQVVGEWFLQIFSHIGFQLLYLRTCWTLPAQTRNAGY